MFGRADASYPTLNQVASGVGGFKIAGGTLGLGSETSGAGDVNGDGLADVILGASGAGGAVVVVFGKADGSLVNPGQLAQSADGFQVIREVAPTSSRDTNDNFGDAVSGAGDVNGDGLADVIVGVGRNDVPFTDAGSAYVVFGKLDSALAQLAGLGAQGRGFAIRGGAPGDIAGLSVSGAGDVNGDGLADVVVGSLGLPGYGAANPTGPSAYVVFGKADGADVNLGTFTGGATGAGFQITGASLRGLPPVSAAGDVNGDGLGDLFVGGAVRANPDGSSTSAAYVVFGKADGAVVNVDDLAAGTGTGGVAFLGASTGSVAGDVNGDGITDLLVGNTVVFGSTDWQI